MERAVADFLAWRAVHAPRHIEIDLSKLAGIRSTAATTREALLVDEERMEDAPSPTLSEPAQPQGEKDEALGLSTEERALLEDLLAGRVPKTPDTDLLVDSINEKLFDLVGDTVLEFDASGTPAIIDDYVDEVRAALT